MCTKAPKEWDPTKTVHGAPDAPEPSSSATDPTTTKTGGGIGARLAAANAAASSLPPPLSGGATTPRDKADLLQFQVYVRQRLSEIGARMPPRLSMRERAEMAFLEEEVIQDHMPARKRRIRDPLNGVPERDIRATNLNLLSRFVSEAGAILPRKLTGVNLRKQKKLERAIKRAHQLALMPRTWKLPRYRHASYADQYSLPERPPPPRPDDDEFRDAPDIRFPNQRENARGSALEIDLSRLVRASAGLKPRPGGSAS
jgi:small subunit ribosomal protein S18